MKTLIFFGATGNLFTRKIFPALSSLFYRYEIRDLALIALGRRFSEEEDYRRFLQEIHQREEKELLERIFYLPGDLENPEISLKISQLISKIGKEEVIFYLSTPPSLYKPALKTIEKTLSLSPPSVKKVALEKPFGSSEKDFEDLEKALKKNFREEEIFYVDHYLGKATVQNLIILKAENLFIEKLLSRSFVKEVRIAVSEKEGIGERKKFYEETGAIKDILQNHLLQLLTLLAIDIPPLCEEDKKECQRFLENVAQAKSQLLTKIQLPPQEAIYLGQYQSYREEVGNPHSQVETLVYLPLYISSERWQGVPFRILTGKRMAERESYIEVVFHSYSPEDNRLRIEIQPEERIDLFIRVKTPEMGLYSSPARLNFTYSGNFGANTPGAYEKIIYDLLAGDRTLFPDSTFIRHAWQIVDQLISIIHKEKRNPHLYPEDTLTARDFWSSPPQLNLSLPG
ncbi:MAG TPA: hypothetical protein PK016_08185 [Candidatus Atribacteria bacterium]|nr:hypothetical protein [Candidatus Atribacteria bacterium]